MTDHKRANYVMRNQPPESQGELFAKEPRVLSMETNSHFSAARGEPFFSVQWSLPAASSNSAEMPQPHPKGRSPGRKPPKTHLLVLGGQGAAWRLTWALYQMDTHSQSSLCLSWTSRRSALPAKAHSPIRLQVYPHVLNPAGWTSGSTFL